MAESDVNLSSHKHVSQSIQAGPIEAPPKNTAGPSQKDSISQAEGTVGSKEIQSDSPVLLEAIYDMWMLPSGTQMVNQNQPGAGNEISGVGWNLLQNDDSKPDAAELFTCSGSMVQKRG